MIKVAKVARIGIPQEFNSVISFYILTVALAGEYSIDL
jgi:hypothetical protein